MSYQVDGKFLKKQPDAALLKVRREIGQRIKDLREKKELTQEELADLAGIGRRNMIKVEQGVYSTTLDVLTKIATALGGHVEIVTSKKKM